MGESFLRGKKPRMQHVTPSIDLGSPRTWQTVPIQRVERGDIVPDFGAVESVEYLSYKDSSFRDKRMVRVQFVSGKRHSWEFDTEIYLFTH